MNKKASVSKLAEDLPDETKRKIYRKVLGVHKGITVQSVNGEAVRDLVDGEFAVSGNPNTADYIPENEIWIEDAMHGSDLIGAVYNELKNIGIVRSASIPRPMSGAHTDFDKSRYKENLIKKTAAKIVKRKP